eukprot:gene10158-11241_t
MRTLENPGSLCYLLSTLYQLYAMPAVQDCVQHWTADSSSKAAVKLRDVFLSMGEVSSKPVGEDVVLDLYATIQHAIGEAVDATLQKDASEFLGDLLSALREVPPQQHFANLFLRGLMVNQLRAKDGELRMDIEESFYFLPLTVDGLTSLDESLRLFLQTDTVDFRWRTGKAASTPSPPALLPTQKKIVLKQLPRHLVFLFNRFRYDRAHHRKIKLHNRFSFPHRLDMSPFLRREEEDGGGGEGGSGAEEYHYRLSGVTIHRGRTAHSGHYYALIRDRSQDGQQSGESREEEHWHVFDDDCQQSFDVDQLAEEAFGSDHVNSYDSGDGSDYDSYNDDDSYSSSNSEGLGADDALDAPRSAMIVIYDRVI